MKRIVLAIAVTLPVVACGKEEPKKVEVRPEARDRLVWRRTRLAPQ